MLTAFKTFLHKAGAGSSEKNAADAYDIWSDSYDWQPGNLMLDLDELIFSDLLSSVSLKGKIVADIGCGTGRHWEKLYKKSPDVLMGFDVSNGMLKRLKDKFPSSITQRTTDTLLKSLPDGSLDCLITTMTIAHIENIEEAISSWSRVLRNGGDLIITDFHPATLAKGGKRSFKNGKQTLSVINFMHPLEKVKTIFDNCGFTLIKQKEKYINEEVKSYYEAQNALAVYDKFKGLPIIYGLHLKKKVVTE